MYQKDIHYKDHKYVIQNRVQELLDHMYPIPEDFRVKPEYLLGITEAEFNDGFRCLWRVISELYKGIIADPESFGLPLYEDYERGKSDRKWNDSEVTSRRLMDFLDALCVAGELKNNILSISPVAYKEHIKKNRLKMTSPAAIKLMSRLTDFGFTFSDSDGNPFSKTVSDFELSYEENANLIPALKGYCCTNIRGKMDLEFYCCQYHLVTDSDLAIKPARAFAFSQYLMGEQKEFFIAIHERMLSEGFICKPNWTFGSVLGVEYCTKTQLRDKRNPWLIRCLSNHNQLDMTLKMYHIATYTDFLAGLPEQIKASYKATNPCSNEKCCDTYLTCHHRYVFSLDGNEYAVHLYGGYGAKVRTFNIDDVDSYVALIKKEAEGKM